MRVEDVMVGGWRLGDGVNLVRKVGRRIVIIRRNGEKDRGLV